MRDCPRKCTRVSIPLRKFPRYCINPVIARVYRCFHSTKEVSKVEPAKFENSRICVSIPLRKFPREENYPGKGEELRVSIPLRKFPRKVGGLFSAQNTAVSIPLRKFPRQPGVWDLSALESVSIPLRKFPRIKQGRDKEISRLFPFH